MFTLILVLHIIVCVFLIFIVLIQSSKGAELGAAFGGSSQTLFGTRGAATFLSKLTTVAAIVFMLTSLTLAVFSVRQGSIVLKSPVKPAAEKPFSDEAPGPLKEQPASAEKGQEKTPLQPEGPLK